MKYRKKTHLLGRLMRAAAPVFPENYFPERTEYRVESEIIPKSFDGFRLVQLSDLHGCTSPRNVRLLLELISTAAPDAVVLTGDMADRLDRDYTALFGLFRTLCQRYPVFFVSGNHEQELIGARRREFYRGMAKQGVRILDSDSVEISRSGETIRLYGLRIPLRYYRRGRGKRRPELSAEKIETILGSCGGEYAVLLAHNPFFFEACAQWGADLTLSGHVHGGMVRLPYIGGLLSPERRFFPRYSGGMYESEAAGGRRMIVSRGLGKGARLGNRPEVVSVTLYSRPKPERTTGGADQ